jgi:hypothetical protein
LGVLNKEKALLRLRRNYGLYYFQPFAQASFARSENNKALMLRIKAFSL